MKGWPIAVIGVAATFAWPQNPAGQGMFAGRWVVPPEGDAAFRQVYALEQSSGTVTGRVINTTSEQPIVDVAIADGTLTFATVAGRPPNERRTEYRLRPSGSSMAVTFMRPGRNPETLMATRGSATAGDAPARIELPALHRVPANGLAKTPPMGWNSWNYFRARVDDATVRAIADAMVTSGMKAAGYTYVNIDDTWEGARDASGRIQTNRKFPNMKALADYVHSKGLKLGIYSSPGHLTCAGYEGSYGHEEIDAKTFAGWGIDYLKYDWCSAARVYKDDEMQAVYQKMGDALRASGRDIVYSLCQYGRNDVWKWGPDVGGHLWRTTGDISDNWESMTRIGFSQDGLAPYAGPGHWNDPDMLEIGNGGMTAAEYRTHMSLWAMLAAPLLAGNDLRAMSTETAAILTNPDVIAIDQDQVGRQGRRLRSGGTIEVWSRLLSGGKYAIAMFNRGDTPAMIEARWSDLGLSGAHTVHDLWRHRDAGRFEIGYQTQVEPHGVSLIRVQ